jgi:O-methyltransferase
VPRRFRAAVKVGLVRLGSRLPERVHYELNAALNYLWAGAWTRRRGFVPLQTVPDRYAIFDRILEAAGSSKLVYLEFGVGTGDSMRYWASAHTNAASELHGFDSFEGLPSDWILGRPAGHFSTGGTPPEIGDSRIRFHVGWFEETLATFTVPQHEKLVVALDADLYSSTVTVLRYLRDKVTPGTVLYFDEFNHRADELRAFDEFLAETGLTFQLLAATPDLAHVAFVAVERSQV